MKLNFRKIKATDIDEAYELEVNSFSAPWPKSAFEEIVDKKDADYFLAEDIDNNKLIAGCVLFYIVDEGDIFNVAVNKDYQGNGIATKLIEFAISQGVEAGLKDFTLEVRKSNIAAIRVYEKCGFESEGIRPGFYSNPKEDAVIMWRRNCGLEK